MRAVYRSFDRGKINAKYNFLERSNAPSCPAPLLAGAKGGVINAFDWINSQHVLQNSTRCHQHYM